MFETYEELERAYFRSDIGAQAELYEEAYQRGWGERLFEAEMGYQRRLEAVRERIRAERIRSDG